jgi:hypothetical protein
MLNPSTTNGMCIGQLMVVSWHTTLNNGILIDLSTLCTFRFQQSKMKAAEEIADARKIKLS